MIYGNVIAQAAEASQVVTQDIDIVPIDFIWEQIISLSWLEAVLAISFGLVYLMYGWRIFKVLVVISFGLIGLFAGRYVGRYAGNELWGAIIGLAVLSLVSMGLMKWCICILGAIAGGILTAGLWHAFGLPQMYLWAGAIVGVVAGGMISFIVLKASVMLFTSLGGGIIMMVGVLALLHIYETKAIEPATQNVQDWVFNYNWFLPVAMMIPTVVGIVMQKQLINSSKKWEF